MLRRAIDKTGPGLPCPENDPQIGIVLATAINTIKLGIRHGVPIYFDAIGVAPIAGNDTVRRIGGCRNDGSAKQNQQRRINQGNLSFHNSSSHAIRSTMERFRQSYVDLELGRRDRKTAFLGVDDIR